MTRNDRIIPAKVDTRPYTFAWSGEMPTRRGFIRGTRRKMWFTDGGGAAVETLAMEIGESIRFFDPFHAQDTTRLDRIAPTVKREVQAFEIVEAR